ncbi:efflux RND transporter periplasmic adaptor subunit [Actibacterium lipolyticum]|uniref:Multidrug efflux pump subunit AcrA n=1 Tax=Actibacterium lipolyticum TaxID=1524263 RepID=A0A238KSF5_9RHOB|nr:HlyD family efflux transporter periplasmic adaptor subunit [Actibacterium lipolyticum]SMX45784.1 Multidrug efflux pump subunit AcrA precursor [Actibacterium lipolyticum]
MRFLRRSLVGLFLLALTVGLLAYAGQSIFSAMETRMAKQTQPRAARERVFAANVVSVTLQDVTPVLTAFGEVRSRRTLDVRATAEGTVVELNENFEEGGHVQAGDLLFRVDQADAQAALDVAKADLAEAEAEQRDATRALVLAQDDLTAAEEQARLRVQALTRQQSLKERGFGTDALVEEAELAAASAQQSVVSRRQSLAIAESRVDQASTQLARERINLAEAERGLADTEIFAEFSGTLSDVGIVRGGVVANNEQVAQLIDPDELEVSFRISTPQYSRLLDESGGLLASTVSVVLDAYGADLEASGTITRESAAVAEGQTGRLLFARLTGAKGFRPGDFVTVRVDEPQLSNVAVLPSDAVDAASTVLVIGEDDRLEVATVELLRRQGDDVVVRAADLQGREIVAERSPLLGAGIKVRPIRPEAGNAAPTEPDLVELTPERRAQLIAFIEGNQFMPADAKERVLAQLAQEKVPARTVERIESRMGG